MKTQTEEKDDLDLKDIKQFYGTVGYHEAWLNVKATDGVAYVMRNGYTWLVTDAISVIRTLPRLKGEDFIVVKLLLHNPPLEAYNPETDTNEKVAASMVMDDGNNNPLYHQNYTATTAKVPLKLYFVRGEVDVMLLPSEY